MTSFLSRHGLKVLAFGAVVTVAAVPACVGGPPEFDDAIGEYADEVRISACTASAIRGGTPAERRAIIDRALDWVARGVMYSQTPQSREGGYRTDCSGLVSMAWGLGPPGNTTHSFAGGPWDNGKSRRINWNELQPGDALNSPQHHIMLFAGWLDENQTRFCTIEEYNWGRPASILHHTIHDTTRGQPFRAAYIPCRFTRTPPGSTATPGGGGTSPSMGSSCYSQTLSRSMPSRSCVESRFDRTWYQCNNGAWQRGGPSMGPAGACSSQAPLAGSSGNSTCRSDTLGRNVNEGSCVQSRFDRVWYQCTDTGWVHDPNIASGNRGPIGGCSARYPL